MTDLDELAVKVGRETLVDLEEWPIATPPRDRIMAGVRDDSLLGRTAILGARAMLAKLREMGLVVGPLSQGAIDAVSERRRQVEVEGYTPAHDDRGFIEVFGVPLRIVPGIEGFAVLPLETRR